MPGTRLVAGPAVERALDRLVQRLCEAGGNNVLGIALYGGLARGQYTPGVSDVNILVVLADARLPALLPLAPSLTAALRQSQVVPFVATPGDLREAARLFPVKLLDIQVNHRLLYGDIHVAGIAIDPESLRVRTLQEIRNLELRLRQRVLERGAEVQALWTSLVGGLPKLAATLEALLLARGLALPAERQELLRLAGQELGLDGARVERVAALRRSGERPSDDTVRERLDDYFGVLAEVGERLAEPAARQVADPDARDLTGPAARDLPGPAVRDL